MKRKTAKQYYLIRNARISIQMQTFKFCTWSTSDIDHLGKNRNAWKQPISMLQNIGVNQVTYSAQDILNHYSFY